jgi:cell division protein FtsN
MRKSGYNVGKNGGTHSSATRKGSSLIWVGVLVGILAGVGLAAGVAWYLMKSPKPFLNKEQPAKIQPEPAKPAVSATTGTSAEKAAPTQTDGKRRFEFYTVLTDKPSVVAPIKPTDKTKPAEKSHSPDNKKVAAYEPQILQAGSFSSVNDAEKLKARLALLGLEANIQTATLPDKGVWYRVRLGPYKNPDELGRASNFLKQNGVDSTPMRAQ